MAMLISRQSLDGQSLAIAISKWAGTACASIAFAFFTDDYNGNRTLIVTYIGSFILDGSYAAMIVYTKKHPNWLVISHHNFQVAELPSPTPTPTLAPPQPEVNGATPANLNEPQGHRWLVAR
jgi:hypothetical protein